MLMLYGVCDVRMSMGHRWNDAERGIADELGEKRVPMTPRVPQIPLLPTLTSTLGCSLHNRLLISYFTPKCYSNGKHDYKQCFP
jgi:hypothetical protein